jgi:hypothetical protein
MLWWIIGLYLLIGLIVTLIFVGVEPIIMEAPWLLPFTVILFPYIIYVIIRLKNDKGGRWI